MKKTFLPVCMLLVTSFLYGQAIEGSVEYQKSLHQAAIIELPYTPAIVTAAMNDYLSKKGKSKANDIKGFITYRNTQTVTNDSVNADLYFKVERKSRQQKEITVLSLLLAPKDGTAVNNLRYMDMGQAKTYLNELAPAIESYNLEQQINDQNDAVIKAESKYKSLVDDSNDLDKKRTAIEKKIMDNKHDQQNQLNEVENQKQKLAVYVSQRKS